VVRELEKERSGGNKVGCGGLLGESRLARKGQPSCIGERRPDRLVQMFISLFLN
jgi:hypothetical protein